MEIKVTIKSTLDKWDANSWVSAAHWGIRLQIEKDGQTYAHDYYSSEEPTDEMIESLKTMFLADLVINGVIKQYIDRQTMRLLNTETGL